MSCILGKEEGQPRSGRGAFGAAWRLRLGLAAVMCLAASTAPAQQVWKCEVGGKVHFSDKPCPGSGRPVPERSLQPNVVDSLKPEAVRAALEGPGAASAAVPAAAVPSGNVCPGAAELRGMETRAGSTTLGDAERQFLQDEVRRARQCAAGQGRYREADWVLSREAQAAQTQIGDRAREDARRRAEDMHSAADPEEGERIARRRIAEERLQRRLQHGHPHLQGPRPGQPHPLPPQQQPQLPRGQNPASAPTR